MICALAGSHIKELAWRANLAVTMVKIALVSENPGEGEKYLNGWLVRDVGGPILKLGVECSSGWQVRAYKVDFF